ncbi:MAG: helix-turn-helix transcriptional regulator [Clostridia bacterium]|nr:helix-turn-helix transcriptional regulator [Clostridia bacterium]
MIRFSKRLQLLRKEANLKQIDLAKILNTTQRRISHLESGKIEPDLATLVAIAKYFKVTLDYLVGITDY